MGRGMAVPLTPVGRPRPFHRSKLAASAARTGSSRRRRLGTGPSPPAYVRPFGRGDLAVLPEVADDIERIAVSEKPSPTVPWYAA